MAASSDHASIDIGHPAPDRGRVDLWLLLLCLLAAPVLWSLQHLVLYSFASLYCSSAVGAAWIHWLLPAVNLAALFAAALATLLAYRNLRQTRREYGGSGGIMDAGEGRTRFLSIWGIWLGVVFMLAIAFNTIAVFWVGLCRV
jgi:hypothetical protein